MIQLFLFIPKQARQNLFYCNSTVHSFIRHKTKFANGNNSLTQRPKISLPSCFSELTKIKIISATAESTAAT